MSSVANLQSDNASVEQAIVSPTSLVCKSPEEKHRLVKFFQILIAVDQRLKKQSNETD